MLVKTHYFEIEDACKYGVDAAILLQNMRFWVYRNIANNAHCYGTYIEDKRTGRISPYQYRHWTYNTYEGWAKLFPYWSTKQIRRILNSLVKANVLIRGSFNKFSLDRTLWYALAKEECPSPFAQMGKCDLPKRADSSAQMGRAIPDIDSDIKDSPSRLRVAKDKPKKPVSTLSEKNNGAESFRPNSPQSPHAWAQYFTQRLHHRPGKPMLEKESALFVRWVEDGVRIEEVEEAIGIVEGRQTLVPSSPLYYREIVEEIRRAKAWEEKNPAPKGAAPDTNKRYKKQAPDYDSFQQPSQHAFKDYIPEEVTPSSPETAKSFITQLNRLTNRCLTSAPRAAHLSARNLIGKSRC